MPARDYALHELDRRDLPNWRADLYAGEFPQPPDDPRDRALAEQIIALVVKNLLLIQRETARLARRPAHKIDPIAQKVIAVGMVQLRFLDRIPPSAAVNEAVEQAKRQHLGKATAFVNAVLRKAAADPHFLPLAASPSDVAERHLSVPDFVYARLEKAFGAEEAMKICHHSHVDPPALVRLFAGASVDDLAADGVSFRPHEHPGLFVASGAKQADFRRWAEAGLAQVQDATAAAVVDHLDLQPGQTVLDRCCGLGTKTLQLAERVGPAGRVVAMDPDGRRCEALQELIKRRGIANVEVVRAAMLAEMPEQTFDRILVDAPCSNSGVFARRPEAKYRQQTAAIKSLEKLQRAILADSAPRLRPGGVMVYSTCSVWPGENGGVVGKFLEALPEFKLVEDHLTLPTGANDPTRYRDGGYWAKLRRGA